MAFEYFIEEFLVYHFLFNYLFMLVLTYHPRANDGRRIDMTDVFVFHPVLLLLLYGIPTGVCMLLGSILVRMVGSPVPYCVVLALQYYVTLFAASVLSRMLFDRELLIPSGIGRSPDAVMVEAQEVQIEGMRQRQRQLEQENAELHQRWYALAFPDGTHRPQVPVIQTPLVIGPPEESQTRRIIRRESTDEVR